MTKPSRKFHHARLPDFSTLLSGHTPPDEIGFRSDGLQIWYNNTGKSWIEIPEKPHLHTHSDEIFVVMKGALIIEVDGQQHRIGEREFCCFPAGLFHAILEVETPSKRL